MLIRVCVVNNLKGAELGTALGPIESFQLHYMSKEKERDKEAKIMWVCPIVRRTTCFSHYLSGFPNL